MNASTLLERERREPDAFRVLERTLVRRRAAGVDARLRVELVALAALILGFLFWQVRIPLDSLERRTGVATVAEVEFAGLAALALGGGGIAFARHAVRLRRGPGGPAWLALPVSPRALGRHLAWGSRTTAWLALVPATAWVLAAVQLVPAWWLVLLFAIFVWMLLEAARLGCWLAVRDAVRRAEPRPGLDDLSRVLVAARRVGTSAPLPAARWRRQPAWRALLGKDLLVTRRPSPARQRAIAPLVLLASSAVAWALPVAPALAHALAFALGLLTAATLAEWIIAVAGTDPFPVLRGLPLGVASVWGARLLWAVLGSASLLVVQALCARALHPMALQVLLVWLGAASLAIGALGANYAVTLYPRVEHAQRMLALSLGLAIAASLMIPLVGWVLVFTALLHSARRLPGWSRQEAF